MTNLKGWRTLAFSVGIIALIGALQSLQGFDWEAYVSLPVAIIIREIIGIGLRFITKGPVGASYGLPSPPATALPDLPAAPTPRTFHEGASQ